MFQTVSFSEHLSDIRSPFGQRKALTAGMREWRNW